ncbi:MAG: glutamine-hydrolyzing carbamoyl-phosphate synthase small subunit [Acidobacteria bacterium]|nr:glutamine-hydrolyzing carbamoyl-phosphate synthase small subunit [Acidobacteriota bacterium]
MNAILALEDGRTYMGRAFGAVGESSGEVVFNTSMAGYQEILTDPSYAGQIVVMTYPHIGNYGTNSEDMESHRPFVEGLVVRELSACHSSWRSDAGLDGYLKEKGVVAVAEIDTRALVRHIRTRGALRGIIGSRDPDPARLVARARELPAMVGRDLASAVSCRLPYAGAATREVPGGARFRVVAYDFGIKRNILRCLALHGCEVTVVPATTAAEQVLQMRPGGVLLSNGPGDPEPVQYAVNNIRRLLGRVPIFGICLGHQLLGLALGGRTYKLKFGHRGANHPVKNLLSGRVEITSHNHGFAVDADSLDPGKIQVTHLNLNDSTLEGFRHRDLPAFAVQYHPEASPGPHDSLYLFEEFTRLMTEFS